MKNMRDRNLDSRWDKKELGASEEHVKKVDHDENVKVDTSLGLQTISIRLPKKLIDELKRLARDDGIGYQPYVRQLLMQHVRAGKSKNDKRSVGR
jgi:predicted DNA binding CopG/RHH family protein